MQTNNDDVVIRLQAELDRRKAELVQPKPKYLTNMQFRYNQGGPVTNIHTVSDIETLIKMYACIKRHRDDYKESVIVLKLTADYPTFTWEGFQYEEWKADIETKLNVRDYQEKKQQYDELEKRLIALESTDLKTSKELEAIIKILGG